MLKVHNTDNHPLTCAIVSISSESILTNTSVGAIFINACCIFMAAIIIFTVNHIYKDIQIGIKFKGAPLQKYFSVDLKIYLSFFSSIAIMIFQIITRGLR